jgi:hypothetical protein
MSSTEFVVSIGGTFARIYFADAPDLFAFMLRTGTGFWTWTMMHHFSRYQTTEITNRADAIESAREIAREVTFIRQEIIDEDVERILHLKSNPGARVNVSERARKLENEREMTRIVTALDGDVAAILGGYEPRHLNYMEYPVHSREGWIDRPSTTSLLSRGRT